MSKTVRFNGRVYHGATDTLATPPLVGIWSVGEERLFDARLAHELGRACGDACEGNCWAEFFVAVWNQNFDPHTDKNARWFEIVAPAAPPITTTPASRRGKEQ